MDYNYNNTSGMTQELVRWCSQIDILKHIQLDHFAESFNDGVLFFYLVQELLPEMTEELAILHKKVTRIVAETDFFGKLDNWKLLNNLILEKLMIMRSEWFLGYVARGKDGYIQDLLADLMKVVPEPAGDREKRELLLQNRSTTWAQDQNANFESSYDETDKALVAIDDENEDNKQGQPSFSFYHTPLSDEEDQEGQRGNDRWRRRVTRFSNNSNEGRVDNRRWGSGSQYHHQRRGPLRRIQRNGSRDFINKSRRTDFRYFRNNQHQHQPGNQNSYNMNQRTGGKREQGPYQRYLIPRDPRDFTRGRQAWKPRPYQQQQQWNQGHQQWNQGHQQHRQGPQMNEQDYLNQRFNEMQNNAGGYSRSRRSPFAKYFYRYYLQFVPVSCNNCIDNNRQCYCPRFGYNQQIYNQQMAYTY